MSDVHPAGNIGLGQQKLRAMSAIGFGVAALALAIFLVVVRADPLWRLTIYLPLVIAAGGYFEARAQTCVALAMSGECSLEDRLYLTRTLRGDKINDEALAARLRKRGTRLILKIHGTAIGLALLFYLLPI